MNMFDWKNDLITNFHTAADWTADAGPPIGPDATPFNVGVRLEAAAPTPDVADAKGPKLTTIVNFKHPNGENPRGALIADAAGDLFGTTYGGGKNGDGTVFEIVKTQAGYASTPTTLVSFAGADGANPEGSASLFTDAAGDLFGTTLEGGANNDGTVFEIVKTQGGYASAPTTLVSFAGADGELPYGGLIADAAGDLFGTTAQGGADEAGTVFEVAKTQSGYASAPTILVSFTGADGDYPEGSLIADAAGDLFGTTADGGADNAGAVFEIAKTKSGYASAPTVLVSFTGAKGSTPIGGLIADATGDLFGTTQGGGSIAGTVFEIAKTKSGYASAATTLVSFTGADGEYPEAGLIADAAGNLFGTTTGGGTDGDGTVFEIAKTKSGYASAPTTLVTFTGANGQGPVADLFADAVGDLFGTTTGGRGPYSEGTVFEITNSGFVPPATPVTPAAHGAHASPPGAAFVQAMASFGASRSGETTPTFLAGRQETSMQLSLPHQVA